ncbi:LOW QUALITY PROTEIN: protocadherin gamma-B4-like [Bufo gargarizans]|uniref:LOW QUALITY PROTEIN: protocadherin gamma-B4-like n=1 Tax=Bufo gargarizans TaxID=30331 RepID=UPI001CF536B5|nr:LOW QUALITY PROTEIN: protocadherin gamma-B4-like [Bufo gargarizans]
MDIIILSIDFLQRSILESREKISAIETQLAATIPSQDLTDLKNKTDKVLDEHRKYIEQTKRSKYIRDTEDYQLNRVYRWQWQEPNTYGQYGYADYASSSSGSEKPMHRRSQRFFNLRGNRSRRKQRGYAGDDIPTGSETLPMQTRSQRSILESREKISAIETQLAATIPSQDLTDLKNKTDKVLDEHRKYIEQTKRSKYIRDTEDYQLNRVYRWQWQEPNTYGQYGYADYASSSSGSEKPMHRRSQRFFNLRGNRSRRKQRGYAGDDIPTGSETLPMQTRSQTRWYIDLVTEAYQVHYSVLEEIKQNTVIGNLAVDLGISKKELETRKLRVISHNKKHNHFNVSLDGNLYVTDRIDREELCSSKPICHLDLEVLVENPVNVFPVTVQVLDINDNSPCFSKDIFAIGISESASPGAHFILGNAFDSDLGSNSIQSYSLSPNPYFTLGEKTDSEGTKHPELILEQPLDRENQPRYILALTAYDGGNPLRTGTALIQIDIQDVNDNYPVFSQDTYRVTLKEDTSVGSVVLKLNASDRDEGSYGQVTYSFSYFDESAQNVFSMDSQTGVIKTMEELDYETTQSYKMSVEAKDGGGLVAKCALIMQIEDVNDNIPEIMFASLSTKIPEDALPGTLVALINVKDLDSKENGDVVCQISESSPFNLIQSSNNYYKLVTTGLLDREKNTNYNVTIIAEDGGSPPMISKRNISITVLDVNDNPPVFDRTFYIYYIPEQTPAGTSIQNIHAQDTDENENAQIIYSIINSNIENIPVTSYVSINSVTGVIYAQRKFDYEQLREFQFQVMAKDSGSPPLSTNVTVRICIIDKNDNAPKILYPSPDTEGSALFEFIPHSAEKGYLVTKVIAVDSDSGHNAWLSYHLLQVPDPSLFTIGQYTGEIRIGRDLPDMESLRQKLVVLVKDNGVPSLSSTVTLNLVMAENFQQVVPDIRRQPNNPSPASNATFYLVIAIALISVLFIVTVLITVIFKCKKTHTPMSFGSYNRNVYPQFTLGCPSEISDTSLPFPFSYDVCVTLDSKQNEIAYLKPVQNVPTENLIDTENPTVAENSMMVNMPTESNTQVSRTLN